MTNVASYCGFTDNHYKDYVSLQSEMGPNFQVLAFPCNQFGAQEPEVSKSLSRCTLLHPGPDAYMVLGNLASDS